MYVLIFYVPTTHVETVKEALFAVGAGKVGSYQKCAWQVLGQGQFMPEKDSKPFLGMKNCLTFVEEYRVEMVFEKALYKEVVAALKNVHPYETPAYQVLNVIALS